MQGGRLKSTAVRMWSSCSWLHITAAFTINTQLSMVWFHPRILHTAIKHVTTRLLWTQQLPVQQLQLCYANTYCLRAASALMWSSTAILLVPTRTSASYLARNSPSSCWDWACSVSSWLFLWLNFKTASDTSTTHVQQHDLPMAFQYMCTFQYTSTDSLSSGSENIMKVVSRSDRTKSQRHTWQKYA